MTSGNYRISRAVSYPDYPGSVLIFDAQVTATTDTEWDTEIGVQGTYTGPTDIAASDEYQLTWYADFPRLLESGSAILRCTSGERVRQTWSSIITPTGSSKEALSPLRDFPARGQIISVTISPFRVDGNRMEYEWEGTVAQQE